MLAVKRAATAQPSAEVIPVDQTMVKGLPTFHAIFKSLVTN